VAGKVEYEDLVDFAEGVASSAGVDCPIRFVSRPS
jgi:hypothetical protein